MSSQLITAAERRSKPRMDEPVPVRVRGSECSGKSYRFETVARNIGPGGLCAFSPRIMQPGERVALHIRFARIGARPPQAPEVLVRGIVVRVEARPNGSCLFAVSFLLRRVE
jgi:hypothetical protein